MRAIGLAMRAEDAVGSSRTDGEQLGANLVGQVKMAVALKAGDQLREKGDKTLGTDEVGGSPGGGEGLLNGRSIVALTRTGHGCQRRERLGQEADGVLAGIASGSDEFIEDDRLVWRGSVAI